MPLGSRQPRPFLGASVYEDPDFWVYYQPVVLYSTLASRPVRLDMHAWHGVASPDSLAVPCSAAQAAHVSPCQLFARVLGHTWPRMHSAIDNSNIYARVGYGLHRPHVPPFTSSLQTCKHRLDAVS